ncbi:MAG: hypothetical protein JW929_14610 [Anaerolineales bacterium]|nr:hypothetical protein [Anaerolineales bacterium]
MLKKFFKRTPVYPFFRDARILLRWTAAGKPAPPPHLVKQRVLRQYARRRRLRVLVETGTYRGDMVDAVKRDFERVYSIELGEELFRAAQRRFAGAPNVVLLQGDSGGVLPDLLKQIDRPALFWLDSHYSDADTVRSGLITPIRQELESILKHPLAHRHVILIDDARLFNGEDDYPALESIRAVARDAGFEHCDVEDDIIRIWNGAERARR